MLLLAAALLWSIGGLIAKSPPVQEIPLDHRGPILACYRALFAALSLAPFVRWRRVRWQPGLLPMALSYATMNVLYISALTRTTAAAAIFLQYTSAAWACLLGWLLLRETSHRRDVLALGFALAGIAWIVLGESHAEHMIGNLLGLASGLAYAGVVVGLRGLRQQDPAWLVLLNNLVGGVVLLPWVLTFDVRLDGTQWAVVAAFGVIQLGIPYILFARGLQSVTAQEASLITIIEAVLNPLWVWLLLGEMAPAATWIGGGLIVGGLVLRYTVLAPRGAPRDGPIESGCRR
jgi:drug/metabolite transporter (DMT)-like permease